MTDGCVYNQNDKYNYQKEITLNKQLCNGIILQLVLYLFQIFIFWIEKLTLGTQLPRYKAGGKIEMGAL